MIAYADTGFLVSLYGQDDHSAAARGLVSSRPVLLLTALGEAEFVNALELRVFRKEWTRHEARLVRESFSQHMAGGIFRVEPLLPETWEKALDLARRHTAKLGTRTLDLLHVSAAIVLRAEALYSFDERQRKLAKAEHLRISPG